jgi:hypothetical protein
VILAQRSPDVHVRVAIHETLIPQECLFVYLAPGEQHAMPDINDLSFNERLGLMVERELTEL